MYKIISPATSANMAAGFDSFGVCFNMENELTFEEFDGAIVINNHADTFRNKENLIAKSFYKTSEILGYTPKGVKIDVKSGIPVSRGLGSSASCITAGVTAAYLLSKNKVNKSEIFELSTQIEGHPDNVAPNLFGGASISYTDKGKYKTAKFGISDKFSFITLIPQYKLSTQKARSVLPEEYSAKDCVFNISHASIMVLALISGNESLLRDALSDKLHQPYRAPLIENYDKIVKICKNSGALGCYLSGAGPTMIAVASNDKVLPRIKKELLDNKISLDIRLNKINPKGLEYFEV